MNPIFFKKNARNSRTWNICFSLSFLCEMQYSILGTGSCDRSKVKKHTLSPKYAPTYTTFPHLDDLPVRRVDDLWPDPKYLVQRPHVVMEVLEDGRALAEDAVAAEQGVLLLKSHIFSSKLHFERFDFENSSYVRKTQILLLISALLSSLIIQCNLQHQKNYISPLPQKKRFLSTVLLTMKPILTVL